MLAHSPRLRSAPLASWSDESGSDEKEISIERKFLWNFFRQVDSCNSLRCGSSQCAFLKHLTTPSLAGVAVRLAAKLSNAAQICVAEHFAVPSLSRRDECANLNLKIVGGIVALWLSTHRKAKSPPTRRAFVNSVNLKKSGAGEGARTLDPDLGKVVLYH
jgi:hypothetical protein